LRNIRKVTLDAVRKVSGLASLTVTQTPKGWLKIQLIFEYHVLQASVFIIVELEDPV
jgi:hypothetical protein